jgi:hypothetical protein
MNSKLRSFQQEKKEFEEWRLRVNSEIEEERQIVREEL